LKVSVTLSLLDSSEELAGESRELDFSNILLAISDESEVAACELVLELTEFSLDSGGATFFFNFSIVSLSKQKE
jgi:hypothetical protein